MIVNNDRRALEKLMIRPDVFALKQQMDKKRSEEPPDDPRLIKMLVLREHVINSIFWNTLIDMMECEIRRRGFRLSMCTVDEEDQVPRPEEADGFILLGSLPPECVGELVASSKPLVWVDSEQKYPACNQVRANNFFGAYTMTKQAIELGHRRLAFLQSTTHLSYEQRCQGMLDCAAEYASLGVTCEVVETAGPHRAQDVLVELLSRKEMPTFLQACCDSILPDVYKVAEQLFLRIPEDFSVAGFDNIHEARLLTPPLASVDVPRVDMAISAVELLTKHMDNPLSSHSLIQVEPVLVVRDSLAPPPTLEH